MAHNCQSRLCATPHDDESDNREPKARCHWTDFYAWDDFCIHLVDVHGWDSERARLFLRDHIEEDAFNEEA